MILIGMKERYVDNYINKERDREREGGEIKLIKLIKLNC